MKSFLLNICKSRSFIITLACIAIISTGQFLFLFELVIFLFVIRFIHNRYDTCRATNPNPARQRIIRVISKFHITCKYISTQCSVRKYDYAQERVAVFLLCRKIAKWKLDWPVSQVRSFYKLSHFIRSSGHFLHFSAFCTLIRRDTFKFIFPHSCNDANTKLNSWTTKARKVREITASFWIQPVNPWSFTPWNKIASASDRSRRKISNRLYLEHRVIRLRVFTKFLYFIFLRINVIREIAIYSNECLGISPRILDVLRYSL